MHFVIMGTRSHLRNNIFYNLQEPRAATGKSFVELVEDALHETYPAENEQLRNPVACGLRKVADHGAFVPHKGESVDEIWLVGGGCEQCLASARDQLQVLVPLLAQSRSGEINWVITGSVTAPESGTYETAGRDFIARCNASKITYRIFHTAVTICQVASW